MESVLVTVSSGIIDRVEFFAEASLAIRALAEEVKTMDIERDDAAVFASHGLVANTKDFLDEDDQFSEESIKDLATHDSEEKSLYLIGNPNHRLGFMVVSPDDPLGYDDPVAAVSDLGQQRKDSGCHLKLYRVVPIENPVALRSQLEAYNEDSGVEDFDYSLVKEYVFDPPS
jgi:hypothetical protein